MNEFKDLKKKKEEKKKGFLAWLREKLGFSPKGMGNISEGAKSINLSGLRGATIRGAGGIFGSGSRGIGGLFSFLGGKGTIVTLALVGLAVGTTLYWRSANDVTSKEEGYSSMGRMDSYVPRILREQNNVSSLDIFKEANKGAINFEEDIAKNIEEDQQKNEENVNSNQLAADLGFENDSNIQFENKPRLQTDMKFGLSSDIGSGSNKFSALGGFGNHMGKFGPQVGSGFDKNSLLKSASGSKISSLKSQKKPVLAKSSKFQSIGGKRAFDQAKAIKSMHMQPNYGKADTARSNLDKAWEGGTDGGGSVGLPSGGSGITDGGSGIVQTPSSLDNIGDTLGGINPNAEVPNVPGYKFDTPWAGMIQKAMMLLMIAALLAGIASMVAKIPVYGKILAAIIALAAIAMGVMVIMIGMKLQSQFGQNKLGMIYMIGGGLAIAGAIAAIGGAFFGWSMLYSQILAAAAGILGMFASMAAGPEMQKAVEKELNKDKNQTSWVITSSHRKYIV